MLTPHDLRDLRAAMGWTPAQLATFLDVSLSQYYRYERENGTPIPRGDGALVLMAAHAVREGRARRQERQALWLVHNGTDPLAARGMAEALARLGGSTEAAGIPETFRPELLGPCPVFLPFPVDDLI